MLIGLDGSLRFTAAGRAHYAPLLTKYGFALENVKTRERFCEVMEEVNAYELDENTCKLEDLFNDPRTNGVERELIRKVLGERLNESKPSRVKVLR